MVDRLEAIVSYCKTNAVCFSFCEENGGKTNACSDSLVSNPIVTSVWVLRVGRQGGEEGGV